MLPTLVPVVIVACTCMLKYSVMLYKYVRYIVLICMYTFVEVFLCILQDDGYIFLWVTGRAMELGRECLKLWGYERCDELIWVKTNQLQRIIRTGRTGHWLNHGKEHCLV